MDNRVIVGAYFSNNSGMIFLVTTMILYWFYLLCKKIIFKSNNIVFKQYCVSILLLVARSVIGGQTAFGVIKGASEYGCRFEAD